MDTGHIAQSSIQWAHHCPALCRQGRPNFLGQLSSCQLPTPFQHGGGGRHPTVWTKRGPRYAPTQAVWSSLHGSKAGPSGLHWRRTQLQDMVHPAPHTKSGGSHPGARAHSRDTLGPSTPGLSLPGPRSFLEHPEDPVVRALDGGGGNLHHPQGGCHQGPQAHQFYSHQLLRGAAQWSWAILPFWH